MKDKIVYCSTERLFNKVQEKMLKTWYCEWYCMGRILYDVWGEYGEKTCISMLEEDDYIIKYESKPYYKEHCSNIPIISAKDYLRE